MAYDAYGTNDMTSTFPDTLNNVCTLIDNTALFYWALRWSVSAEQTMENLITRFCVYQAKFE